ncbi:MAG: cold shock and DUF1294 domain-containing protein [Desulfobacterales bacterium]|nr:cold shock and DUF1294 domain-containing protein [Desulfobacterales bacterium]
MNLQSGTISKWEEDKGFGFITPKSGGKTIFFHINDYSRFHKRPLIGLEVQYFASSDNKGRKCAIDVCPLKGHKNNRRAVFQKVFSTILLCVFACILYYLNISKRISIELVYLYAGMSALTFIIYLKDKSAAEYGTWRTSESTLHILSLLGGWPGASIGQSFLRHKSKKLSFRVMYWLTVIANCGALYLILTPKGSFWLKNLLRNIDFG